MGIYSDKAKKINLASTNRLKEIYEFNKSQNAIAEAALLKSTAGAAIAAGASPAAASAAASAAVAAASAAAASGASPDLTASAASNAAAAAAASAGAAPAAAAAAANGARRGVETGSLDQLRLQRQQQAQNARPGSFTAAATVPLQSQIVPPGYSATAAPVAAEAATIPLQPQIVSSGSQQSQSSNTTAIRQEASKSATNEAGIAAAASKYNQVDTTNIYDYIEESNPTEIRLPRENVCPITYKPLKQASYSPQKMGGLFD